MSRLFYFFVFDVPRFVFDVPHFGFVLLLSLSITLSERGIDFVFDGIAPEWFVFTSYEK